MNVGVAKNGTGGKGWAEGYTQRQRRWVRMFFWYGTDLNGNYFDIRRAFRRWSTWYL